MGVSRSDKGQATDDKLECGWRPGSVGGRRLLLGDLNNDCRVNFADVAVLVSDWLECTSHQPGNCP